LLDPGDRHRPHLIAIDHQVPDRASRRVHGRWLVDRRGWTAADDDRVAALLAPDLEDLALDLVVRDRILRLARLAHDLHAGVTRAQNGPWRNLQRRRIASYCTI